MPSARDNAPAWAHEVAGQVAGMVGLTVVHPIDTVKCVLQARIAPGQPASAMSTVSTLVQKDGPFALYRGIGGAG